MTVKDAISDLPKFFPSENEKKVGRYENRFRDMESSLLFFFVYLEIFDSACRKKK